MKALVFKGVGKPLVIEEFPDPQPGRGELLLKVGRCGICGTDLHMTDGHAQTFPEGSVIGHEFAGTVVAVGKGRSSDFNSTMSSRRCRWSAAECAAAASRVSPCGAIWD